MHRSTVRQHLRRMVRDAEVAEDGTSTSRYTCTIHVTLASATGEIEIAYGDVPQPDDSGLFEIDGELRLVVATASTADLDMAEIQCVGEHLYDALAARVGEAPEDLPWDEALVRAWLPLDQWSRTHLTTWGYAGYAQHLEQTNWLSRCEHLRALLLNRPPSVISTSVLAFHAIRRGHRAIHIHPFVCPLAQADFDGDLVAIFLPVTPEAQHEAGQRLSIAAHVQRDPSLIQSLAPTHDAMWGLAHLSLTPAGRQEIAQIVGADITPPDGFLSRLTLGNALRVMLEQQGTERVLTIVERLMRRGFAEAKTSGASICAFIGSSLDRSHAPQQDDSGTWEAYREELTEQITSRTDYDDTDLGVQLLAIKSGARGSISHIPLWFGGREVATDVHGSRVVLSHGVADGLSAQEVYAGIFQAHQGLGRMLDEWQQLEYDIRATHAPQSFNVLARAMRAQHPGVVFAHAAAIGEVDPLVDIDSGLFVGAPPQLAENLR